MKLRVEVDEAEWESKAEGVETFDVPVHELEIAQGVLNETRRVVWVERVANAPVVLRVWAKPKEDQWKTEPSASKVRPQ